MERKKRAAAFLKLKSAETDGTQKEEVEIRIISKLDDKVHTISDSDNSKDESDKLTSKRGDKRERDYKDDSNDGKRRRKVSKKRKSSRRLYTICIIFNISLGINKRFVVDVRKASTITDVRNQRRGEGDLNRIPLRAACLLNTFYSCYIVIYCKLNEFLIVFNSCLIA